MLYLLNTIVQQQVQSVIRLLDYLQFNQILPLGQTFEGISTFILSVGHVF